MTGPALSKVRLLLLLAAFAIGGAACTSATTIGDAASSAAAAAPTAAAVVESAAENLAPASKVSAAPTAIAVADVPPDVGESGIEERAAEEIAPDETAAEEVTPDETAAEEVTPDELAFAGAVEVAFDDGRSWTLATRDCSYNPDAQRTILLLGGQGVDPVSLNIVETWPLDGSRDRGTSWLANFVDEDEQVYVIERPADGIVAEDDQISITVNLHTNLFYQIGDIPDAVATISC